MVTGTASASSAATLTATSILLLCDCGGSNAANQYLFKQDLQELVNAIGIEIRVAYYPSYCSRSTTRSNARFFPHVGSSACQGLLFDTLDTVVRLMRNALDLDRTGKPPPT